MSAPIVVVEQDGVLAEVEIIHEGWFPIAMVARVKRPDGEWQEAFTDLDKRDRPRNFLPEEFDGFDQWDAEQAALDIYSAEVQP